METLLALLFALMCFGLLSKAQTTISLEDAIRVALPGDKFILNFNVTVQVNQSSDHFVCRNSKSGREIHKSNISTTTSAKLFPMGLEFVAHNSSNSGEYNCRYKNAVVYWVVLVRDEGYKEPPSYSHSGTLVVIMLTVGLTLFSVIGSALLCKGYRDQRIPRQENNGEGRDRGEGEGEIRDEAVTGGSVYSALEHGTTSIYNVLDPAAQNNEMDRRQTKQNVTDETQNAQKEEEIFESVYENF
ncbi:uncharacterized protein si:ch211-243a20.4 [Megalops cyprinoides]|uniref:uncharacterized protein si:ch211-243a20.4 n=1 Tax=Megalops cyprinoides TaxID=118141 RepID=UPI001864384E|nr:uncharacterized protein si:ch211-243a20.4 [Megalops cyprinoides]